MTNKLFKIQQASSESMSNAKCGILFEGVEKHWSVFGEKMGNAFIWEGIFNQHFKVSTAKVLDVRKKQILEGVNDENGDFFFDFIHIF